MSLPIVDSQGRALDVAGIMTRAHWIEEAGFDSIWIGDTFSPGVTRPDPLMWLLAAASATHDLELGTAILQLPLRNPVELAQRVMTMTALTNGRFSLGVGAGSTRSHAAVRAEYSLRFRHLREHIDCIRRLCWGERVGDAFLNPWREAAGPPPILLGTWGSQTWLRRAARDYDGWIASATTGFHTLAEGMKRFRDHGGKRALVAAVLIDLNAQDRAVADEEPYHLLCSPHSAAERLKRLAGLGFDDVLLIKTRHDRQSNLYESDITPDDLSVYRDLLTPGTPP
jgi:alkanesulfonate monooxygenase SsuD/methylene tetrahydromethanopterin reductase-like flavin-dependent oxidoreductase (luciferase family)